MWNTQIQFFFFSVSRLITALQFIESFLVMTGQRELKTRVLISRPQLIVHSLLLDFTRASSVHSKMLQDVAHLLLPYLRVTIGYVCCHVFTNIIIRLALQVNP